MWIHWLALAVAAPPGPHAAQVAHPPEVPAVAPPFAPPPATPGPDKRVYGYLAYWSDDLATIRWDDLSDLALFAASTDATGKLSGTSNWDLAEDAVAMAAPYGVRVHLCVTNFDSDELATLLGDATARQRLIDALASEVAKRGVDGVNVDFEGLPASRRTQMVQFVADLDARVEDVVLATPAVDWSDAWDYAALTEHADLFIMGYGYHWGGSDQAGPVDPLYGGAPWNKYALDWTIDDYLANGARPERVILGLPLYGYAWSTVDGDVPSDTTATGSSVVFSKAWATAAAHGRQWEANSRTPYVWDGSKQTWYGDADSVQERVKAAVDAGLGGVGFWALHYDGDDEALWAGVAAETAPAPQDTGTDPDTDADTAPVGDPAYTADAGYPFLAYVGDHVTLSGEWSTGPDGVALQYLWNQRSGPTETLAGSTTMRPSFTVTAPGTHVFELRVGDGATWSAPAASYVVVLDRDGARDRMGGCATGWSAGLGALAAAAALLRRR